MPRPSRPPAHLDHDQIVLHRPVLLAGRHMAGSGFEPAGCSIPASQPVGDDRAGAARAALAGDRPGKIKTHNRGRDGRPNLLGRRFQEFELETAVQADPQRPPRAVILSAVRRPGSATDFLAGSSAWSQPNIRSSVRMRARTPPSEQSIVSAPGGGATATGGAAEERAGAAPSHGGAVLGRAAIR